MRSKLIAKLTMSTCLSTGLLCGTIVTPAAAISPHIVNDPQGNPFITLRFFDVGDGFYDDNAQSTWSLSDLHKSQIIDATQYWSELIT